MNALNRHDATDEEIRRAIDALTDKERERWLNYFYAATRTPSTERWRAHVERCKKMLEQDELA